MTTTTATASPNTTNTISAPPLNANSTTTSTLSGTSTLSSVPLAAANQETTTISTNLHNPPNISSQQTSTTNSTPSDSANIPSNITLPLTTTNPVTGKIYKNPFVIAYNENAIFNPNDDTAKQFECPPVEPIDGKAQPPYIPTEDKPHRNTNQLQYLLKNVHRPVCKHKHAWPFCPPVDTQKLKLPDYFNVIRKPMDFNTIKKRLENFWYYDAYECIEDFKQTFVNCYTYNKPTEDVVMMAKAVEQLFLDKLEDMPLEEIVLEIPAKTSKAKNKKNNRRITTSNNITGISRDSPASVSMQQNRSNAMNFDYSSNHSQMIDSISPDYSNQSSFPNYNTQDSHPAASTNHNNANNTQIMTNTDNKASLLSKNNPSIYNNSSPSTTTGAAKSKSLFKNLPNSSLPLAIQVASKTPINNHGDVSNHSTSSNMPLDTTSPDAASTNLRSSNNLISQASQNSSNLDPTKLRPSKMSTRRESGRPIKKPQRDLPEPSTSNAVSRPKKGRMTERMRYCQNILKELLHKKHLDVAVHFYEPVDAEALGLADYHEIIKNPMDLDTIKKKMDAREYRKPEQFAADVRLMLHNSFRYNPPEHVVNKCGKKLLEIFEQSWAKIPDTPDDTDSSEASDVPSSDNESDSGGESESEILMNFAKNFQNSLNVLKKMYDDMTKFTEYVKNFAAKRKNRTKRGRSVKHKESKRSSDQQPSSLVMSTNSGADYNLLTNSGADGIGKGKVKAKRSITSKPQQPVKKLKTTNNKHNPKPSTSSNVGQQSVYESEEDEIEIAMSYDEKRRLSLDINKLPGK